MYVCVICWGRSGYHSTNGLVSQKGNGEEKLKSMVRKMCFWAIQGMYCNIIYFVSCSTSLFPFFLKRICILHNTFFLLKCNLYIIKSIHYNCTFRPVLTIVNTCVTTIYIKIWNIFIMPEVSLIPLLSEPLLPTPPTTAEQLLSNICHTEIFYSILELIVNGSTEHMFFYILLFLFDIY